MRIGVSLGPYGSQVKTPAALSQIAQTADRIGLDSLWVAEAYGTDAPTVLAFVAAQTTQIKLGSGIMQIPGRTPANAAMTAMGLDALSGGRFLLGLGMSGPQVVEGWHGVPFGRQLARTREYVEIIRAIVARRDDVEFQGRYYQVPYRGKDSTGQGRPLKTMFHPVRDRIPIYLGALGPKNVELTAELADGWLAFLYAPEHERLVQEPLIAGARKRNRSLADLDIVATVYVAEGNDLERCRDRLRPIFALYIGGMGAPERNFYFNLVCRYGFQSEAEEIQDLYASGRKHEAEAKVPVELIDQLGLVGSAARIAKRLREWESSPVNSVLLGTADPGSVERIVSALG